MDYSVIIRDGQNVKLFDRRTRGQKADQVGEIARILNEIRDTLQNHGYPTSEQWIRAAAYDGSPAVTKLAADAAREAIKAMNAPAFVVKKWATQAADEFPAALAAKVDELHRDFSRARDGVPMQETDITFDDDGIHIDADAIAERLDEGCSWPLSESDIEDAKAVRAVVLELRRLRDRGINIHDIPNIVGTDPFNPQFKGWPEIADLDLFLLAGPRRLPSMAKYRENLDAGKPAPVTAGKDGAAVIDTPPPAQSPRKRNTTTN